MRVLSGVLVAAAALLITAAPLTAAYADPPPWAPAHGYRDKGKHHDKDKHHKKGKDHDVHVYHHYDEPVRYGQPVIVPQGTSVSCDRSLLSGNMTLLSQILGGAGGAVAGAQFGQGTGKLAATAGGALLGVLLGTEVGSSLDAVDAACTQETLELADTGQPVMWRNPDADAQYTVTPTRTYASADTYCREYTTRAQVGSRSQDGQGTACRQPDGTWRVVN